MTDLPVTSNARPSNVVRFEQLMYLSVVIGIAETAIIWNQVYRSGRAGLVPSIAVGSLAFVVLFIWLVARQRQNWARWVLLALYILVLPKYIETTRLIFHAVPLIGTLSLVSAVARTVALLLVFTGNAREWFRPSQPSQYLPLNPE